MDMNLPSELVKDLTKQKEDIDRICRQTGLDIETVCINRLHKMEQEDIDAWIDSYKTIAHFRSDEEALRDLNAVSVQNS